MRKIRKMTKQLSAIAMASLLASSSVMVFAETKNTGGGVEMKRLLQKM